MSQHVGGEPLADCLFSTSHAREIEFVAGVREGFEQVERGNGVPAEEIRELIPSWIVK